MCSFLLFYGTSDKFAYKSLQIRFKESIANPLGSLKMSLWWKRNHLRIFQTYLVNRRYLCYVFLLLTDLSMLLAVMVSFHVQVSQMRSWGNYESSPFLLCPRKKLQTNHHISTPLTPNLSLIIDWIFSFLQKTGKCNPKHWASRSEDEKKENLNLALPHSASSGLRSTDTSRYVIYDYYRVPEEKTGM